MAVRRRKPQTCGSERKEETTDDLVSCGAKEGYQGKEDP